MKEITLKCHTCGYSWPVDLTEEHINIIADAIDSGKDKSEVKRMLHNLNPRLYDDGIFAEDNLELYCNEYKIIADSDTDVL